ncbi:GmrSD restriction endonuclease domain-containing protein [Arthrobacter sp. USHLN218]|uniref:GmrSD restriction endonuclease domain-containing protein n=1 Tax=Arthrobacter sp. USHLN218 TaxID=3081232 RepID=UPI003019BD58
MQKLQAASLAALAAISILFAATGCESNSASATPLESSNTSGSAPAPTATPAESPTLSEPAESEPAPVTEELVSEAPADPSPGTSLAQLETIAIKGRAPKTGYDRDLFGRGWKDPDRNGCDARNDTLNRDLSSIVHKPGTHGCVVASGVLADPLTGTTIHFVRGNATSTAVQIDHVVPLSDAWQKGAQQLVSEEREALGNDPLNLLATDGPTNGAKGDGDAATWLPPNKSFRCEYVAIQTAVKAKYGLWMTQAEHDAIHRILTASCPDQPVPTDEGRVAVPIAAEPLPVSQPLKDAPSGPVPAPVSGADVFYKNCTAVRATGAAPIRVGDPGWDTKFDRDGDGVGCE